MIFKAFGLFLGTRENAGRQKIKIHGGKATGKSGRDPALLESGFNHDGARTAEGIPQQIVRAQPGRERKRSGQRFPERRDAGRRAIAPFVERLTGGIQHQRGFIFKKKKFKLIKRAVLRKGSDSVTGHQAIGRGFFDDALAIRHRKEPAPDGVPFDRERVRRADIILQRQGTHAVKEFGKALGVKTAQPDENPLGQTEKDIGARHIGGLTLKSHAAVHGEKTAATQRVDLLSELFFQPEKAGGNQFHLILPTISSDIVR